MREWRNMIIVMVLVVALGALTGCGKDVDLNTKTVTFVQETITCTPNNPNVCSNDRLTCIRTNYYSQEWECTLVVEEE